MVLVVDMIQTVADDGREYLWEGIGVERNRGSEVAEMVKRPVAIFVVRISRCSLLGDKTCSIATIDRRTVCWYHVE